jgi:hypothetical protein
MWYEVLILQNATPVINICLITIIIVTEVSFYYFASHLAVTSILSVTGLCSVDMFSSVSSSHIPSIYIIQLGLVAHSYTRYNQTSRKK